MANAQDCVDKAQEIRRDAKDPKLAEEYLGALERINRIVKQSFVKGPSAYNRVLAIRRIFDEMEGGDPVAAPLDE